MSAILGVGHFEFCHKIPYCYETWYASSAPCPYGTQKVSGQSYNDISKNANNFCLH